MSDATSSDLAAAWPRAAAPDVPLPAPVPVAAPVLISDVATPLGGETLLSLIWRRLAEGGDG